MQDSQESPDPEPQSRTMQEFGDKVARYRAALAQFWPIVLGWGAIALVAGIAAQFGYGAMIEGRYILALLFYLVIIGLITAGGIYHFRREALRKELTRIMVFIAVVIFVGLACWTYSAHSRKQAQDRQLNELTELVRGQDRFRPERILERYSLGYVIYELNYSNQVLPYANRLLEGYNIDWNTAQILEASDTEVTILLPGIRVPTKGMAFIRNRVTLSRQLGASAQAIGLDEVVQSVELIAIRETGFVFLVGFKEVPIPEEIKRRLRLK